MREVLGFVVPLLVRLIVSFAIVMLDERTLTEEQLARAWPPASRAAALVNFDILALVVHFVKTRMVGPTIARKALGVLIGLCEAAVALGVLLRITEVAMIAVALAFGEPLE